MSIGILDHAGYISYQKADEPLLEYYTTVEPDEVIMFSDGTIQRYLNSVYIENVGDSTLFIQPIGSECCVVIPPQESRNLDYLKLTGIKILGLPGSKFRWSGCYF